MKLILAFACLCITIHAQAQTPFNGVETNLGNLFRTSNAVTRSISAENITGEPGKGGMADPKLDSGKRNVANAAHAARELGKGWKVNPFLKLKEAKQLRLQILKVRVLFSISG